MDITEILEAKRPSLEVAWILLNPELQIRLDALQAELSSARIYDTRHNERDRAPAVEEQIDVLEVEISESRIPFTFKAIGRENYSKLLDEFKAREDNDQDQEVGFDVDEFPPRLFALSAVDPAMDLAQAHQIWDGGDGQWSDAETTKLLVAAIRANKESIDVPFTRLGLRMETLIIGTESPTPEQSESHTPSS